MSPDQPGEIGPPSLWTGARMADAAYEQVRQERDDLRMEVIGLLNLLADELRGDSIHPPPAWITKRLAALTGRNDPQEIS